MKLSNTAKQTMRLRLAVHAKTGGNPSQPFPGEEAAPERDWLCCHSSTFERTIFLVNFPWADNAYARGHRISKSLKRRSAPA